MRAIDLIDPEELKREMEKIARIIEQVVLAASPGESRVVLHKRCVTAIRNDGREAGDAFIAKIIGETKRRRAGCSPGRR